MSGSVKSVPYRDIEDPVILRRLLEATLLLEQNLDLPALLHHVISEGCSMTGARYGALGVLNEDRSGLAEFLTVGLETEEEQRIGDRPTGLGVLGLLISDSRPLRLTNLGDHPDSFGFPPNHPKMESFLGVPIKVGGEVFGNLYLTDKIGWSEFTDDDEVLVQALAISAGIAIQNSRLHERAQVAAVYEDRDRLARDLHDTVIQRLFAVGLSLQSLAGGAAPEGIVDRLKSVVSDIDDTIRQIRSSIYSLGSTGDDRGTRAQVLSLVHSLMPVVGFEVPVSFGGVVDSTISDHVVEHLLATIREALSNIGRHAMATRATLSLSVASGQCRLQVTDNGCGIDNEEGVEGGLGLLNLQRRAEKLNGTMTIESPESGGTSLIWQVPANG